jgi:hypothetical protein
MSCNTHHVVYITLHYVTSFLQFLVVSLNYILRNKIYFMLISYLPRNCICRRDKNLDLYLTIARLLFQREV